MSEEASFAAPGSSAVPNIDISVDQQVQAWAKKLDASPDQIREAVRQVGANASDVEEHLKGSRSTTNADQVKRAL
ncbi:DUF3606 domain-containing protein [Roseateles noduli]|uniref:DUF3606 domain-containing protein n=1 Tax=Roseateles noduli TaxID=2052484 RepID=UPI003D65126A